MSDINRKETQVIVKPGKDVVATMAQAFRDELHGLVQESPKELIIDLSGVEMVDSVGIGVMIATHNSLNKSGGELKIINVAKDIRSCYQKVISEKKDVSKAQQAVYDRVKRLVKEHYQISGISKIVRGVSN